MKPIRHLSEADEAALLAVSAPALLPMLERRLDSTLRKLYGEYHQPGTDLRPTVAAYAALIDLIRDIETKIQTREHKE